MAEDTQVANELAKIVASDVVEANFGSAKRRLAALVDRCKKKQGACAPRTFADVHVMIGIVSVKTLQSPAALQAFAAALEADPDG